MLYLISQLSTCVVLLPSFEIISLLGEHRSLEKSSFKVVFKSKVKKFYFFRKGNYETHTFIFLLTQFRTKWFRFRLDLTQSLWFNLIERLSRNLGEINIRVLQKFSMLLNINFASHISLPSLLFSQISWLNNNRLKLHFLPKNTLKGDLSFLSDRSGDVLDWSWYANNLSTQVLPSMKYEFN